ncbi:hypothetical protein NC652_018467 [Populus alba x Populus x berolinensis]|nr:hypothetical protein NC652_018467 [Populus alba x Populus x berolinensis]
MERERDRERDDLKHKDCGGGGHKRLVGRLAVKAQASARKKWEDKSLLEKIIELYFGEKVIMLFWLTEFTYASIFIMIGGHHSSVPSCQRVHSQDSISLMKRDCFFCSGLWRFCCYESNMNQLLHHQSINLLRPVSARLLMLRFEALSNVSVILNTSR